MTPPRGRTTGSDTCTSVHRRTSDRTSRSPARSRQHRHLLRRVAGHDLRVLIHRRLAPESTVKHADVVDDEAVHRRRLAVARLVEGLLRLQLEAVLLIEDPEQLRVDVRHLLARIGVRRVHVRGDAVADDPTVGPVLGPLGHGVRQLLADPPSNDATSPGSYKRPSRLSKERFSNMTTTTWSSALSGAGVFIKPPSTTSPARGASSSGLSKIPSGQKGLIIRIGRIAAMSDEREGGGPLPLPSCVTPVGAVAGKKVPRRSVGNG